MAIADSFTLNSSENLADWTAILTTRQDILKRLEEQKSAGIENSLDAGLVLPQKLDHLSKFDLNLADFFTVSRVEFSDVTEIKVTNLSDQARCDRSWKRDSTVKDRGNGIFLSDRDASVLGL